MVEDYRSELAEAKPPCTSLYQPTHRHRPDNDQDAIRFRNLVATAGRSLRRGYSVRETRRLLEPLHALAEDTAFWNNTFDGLAVFRDNDRMRTYRLQRPVVELVVVADSFHTRPLIRILQSADRYQVLALGLEKIRLFEGNRDTLDEVELAAGVPRTMADALGTELTEPHLTVASYGGVGSPARRHGHGARKDEVDVDRERFFGAVGSAVTKHHSRVADLPLVLAALPQHQSAFRRISRNPCLLQGGITANPDTLTMEELRRRAWKIVEPRSRARVEQSVVAFHEAMSKGRGASELRAVAEAAAAGRVAALLVDADRHVPGRIEPATGTVHLDDMANPQVDDLFDDIAELVLAGKGDVLVVPGERMPTDSGVAAIHRY